MKTLPLVLVIALAVAIVSGIPSPSEGEAHFERLCASCHGSDGWARDGEAPPLAGSSWVSGPEIPLIRMVLHGVRGPIEVGGEVYDREMPGFAVKLSDEETAALLSFVRGRWGGTTVSAEAVRRVRISAGNRTRYWTVKELLETP